MLLVCKFYCIYLFLYHLLSVCLSIISLCVSAHLCMCECAWAMPCMWRSEDSCRIVLSFHQLGSRNWIRLSGLVASPTHCVVLPVLKLLLGVTLKSRVFTAGDVAQWMGTWPTCLSPQFNPWYGLGEQKLGVLCSPHSQRRPLVLCPCLPWGAAAGSVFHVWTCHPAGIIKAKWMVQLHVRPPLQLPAAAESFALERQ